MKVKVYSSFAVFKNVVASKMMDSIPYSKKKLCQKKQKAKNSQVAHECAQVALSPLLRRGTGGFQFFGEIFSWEGLLGWYHMYLHKRSSPIDGWNLSILQRTVQRIPTSFTNQGSFNECNFLKK